MLKDPIAELQRAIQDLGYAWQAGVTSLSGLLPEQRLRHLGLRPEFADMARIRTILAQPPPAPAPYPPAWDWRSADGADWTTPVREQGECGACVAFATVAVMETMLKRHLGDPKLQPDLSEAHLFFNGCERCCQTGWWPPPALDYAVRLGVPDEASLPYQDRDLSGAESSPSWQRRAVKATGWREIVDVAARKQWIATRGPVIACLGVHEDLMNYVGGVYRHVQGQLLGYHAVCVTGYSEAEQAWLGKSSWGTDWGAEGWFQIGYGECGIDTHFAMYAIEGVVPARSESPPPSPAPPAPQPVVPSSADSGCNWVARLLGGLRSP